MAPSSPSALVAELTEQAGAWPHVSLAPHPPRAVVFRVDEARIGVLHPDGLLEIPVPAPLRTALVDEGFAVPQPARPGREWVATRLREADDLAPAVLLLRLSYLYRRLLRSRGPAALRRIRAEVAQYALPDALDALYEAMLAKRGADASLSGPVE
ncbi:MAG: luciferase family protein [Salinivenus sp.]